VLLQTSGGVSELVSTGVGLTVIVKVLDGPVQSRDPKLKVGVTVMVADIGKVLVLTAIKAIFPVPSAPSPISVLMLVHAYEVVPPELSVAKVTEPGDPLQTIRSAG